jgi:hypothetical protein
MVAKKFFQRLKGILFSPKSEWTVIADEPIYDVQDVMRDYAFPILVSSVLVALVGVGITLKAVWASMAAFAVWLVALSLTTNVVNGVALRFEATADRLQSTKLVVYGSTPMWIAWAISTWLPATVGWAMNIVGVGYGIALCVLGLSSVMKPSPHKQVGYAVVVSISMVVIHGVGALLRSGAEKFFLSR